MPGPGSRLAKCIATLTLVLGAWTPPVAAQQPQQRPQGQPPGQQQPAGQQQRRQSLQQLPPAEAQQLARENEICWTGTDLAALERACTFTLSRQNSLENLDAPSRGRLYFNRAKARLQANRVPDAIEDLKKAIQDDFKPDLVGVELGRLYLFQGDVAQAERAYRDVLATNATLREGKLGLAMVLLQKRDASGRPDSTGALRELNALIAADPQGGDAELHLRKGEALMLAGLADDAVKSLDEAIRRRPGYLEALLTRAQLHLDKGRRAQALADFNAIIATNPTNADTLAGLGAAMTQLKQYERAIELCERAAQVDFKNVTAHVCLGYARTNQGLLQKAEEDFERALQWNNTSAAAHIGRGYLRKRLGNFDGATADFQRALEIDRRSPDALRHLISIHTDRGYLDKALLAFEEASNIHRNDAANFYLRSFIWALKGDPSRARRDIDQAFTLIGTPDSDSYLARAAMNYFLGDTPKAVADAREAIKLNGENGQAHRLLARSLIKQGDLRGAETSLQRAQQLLPNDWNVIRTLGLLELARNNHQKAKDYFERSNDLNPAFNEGFVGLGRAYEGLKLNDLARAEYQRALTKLDYDNDGREARAEAQRRIAALSAPAPAAKTTPVGPLAKGDDPTARPGGGPSPTATGPTLSPGAGGTDAGGSKSASGANPQPPRKVETAADQSLMCRLLGGWLGNARDYTGVKIDIGCGPGR